MGIFLVFGWGHELLRLISHSKVLPKAGYLVTKIKHPYGLTKIFSKLILGAGEMAQKIGALAVQA